jgi:hypothetical protein
MSFDDFWLLMNKWRGMEMIAGWNIEFFPDLLLNIPS